MDFSEETASVAVKEAISDRADPRIAQLITGLVDHLHAYLRELRPTVDEWSTAIDFLTRVGQKCDDTRQEFVLLSDVLGVSMLVETINGQHSGTESTVLGPFHTVASPPRLSGDSIDLLTGGRSCVVELRILDEHENPLSGARVDVWQCSADGFYDVQQPDIQPAGNGRGLFTTDQDGQVWFRTALPRHYPIPTDGPVGELLAALGRHANRPAHIHIIVTAAGHRELTTHLFVSGSPYIDSDAVFAVKKSLIVDFAEVDDPQVADQFGVDVPFRLARYDLLLAPALRSSRLRREHVVLVRRTARSRDTLFQAARNADGGWPGDTGGKLLGAPVVPRVRRRPMFFGCSDRAGEPGARVRVFAGAGESCLDQDLANTSPAPVTAVGDLPPPTRDPPAGTLRASSHRNTILCPRSG